MADLILQVFYFLRPLMFIYTDLEVFGLSLFEILTMGIVGLLFIAFLFSSFDHRRGFDNLDIAMMLFVAWCGIAALLQWDVVDLKATTKWALPFAIYVLLRRLIRTEKAYLRYVRNLLIGFFIVVFFNALAIWSGTGLAEVSWYTGIERYRGVFKELHSMGHTVGFAIMLVGLYFGLISIWIGPSGWKRHKVVALLALLIVPLALYSLLKGNVRTVMVGITIFFGVLLLMRNRKQFVLFISALTVIWFLSPFIQTIFWDIERGAPIIGAEGIGTAGSGRPYIWQHNLELYADWPIEDQIMGIGAGNELLFLPVAGTYEGRTRAWQSHNDYLSALIELGVVGLFLILGIYYFIYRSIQQIRGPERPFFLALMVAVAAMNFLSNSYLNRFGLGQLFVMVMVGVDIARHAQAVGVGRVPQSQVINYRQTADVEWERR